jgi:hypothetical protein
MAEEGVDVEPLVRDKRIRLQAQVLAEGNAGIVSTPGAGG